MDDREIDELITKLKQITEPPSKRWKEDLAQRRKDFWLESADGKQKFRAFARQSTVFPENFSIGLEYEPNDGGDSMILMRCNGPHGDFNGQLNPEHPHFHPHIHKASSRAITRGERAEKYAERTSQFVSIEQAMAYFLEAINVSLPEREKYFEEDLQREDLQRSLFERFEE